MRKPLLLASMLFTVVAMLFISCMPSPIPGKASTSPPKMLAQSEVGFYQELSWSPDGTSLLISVLETAQDPQRFIYRVHRLDLEPLAILPLTPGPMDYWTTWSPDGTRIAFASRSGPGEQADIFVMAADGTKRIRLTDNSSDDTQPAWSPDGSRIAFVSRRAGTDQVFVMNADGTDQARIGETEGEAQTPAWSPDGRRLTYFETASDGTDHVYIINADGTERRRIAQGLWPSWSPDGSQILYGAPEGLMLISASSGAPRPLVAGDVKFGAFSPNGKQIAYIAKEAGNISVNVMKADGTERKALLSRPAPVW